MRVRAVAPPTTCVDPFGCQSPLDARRIRRRQRACAADPGLAKSALQPSTIRRPDFIPVGRGNPDPLGAGVVPFVEHRMTDRRMILAELGVRRRNQGVAAAVEAEIASLTHAADDRTVGREDEPALAGPEYLGCMETDDRGRLSRHKRVETRRRVDDDRQPGLGPERVHAGIEIGRPNGDTGITAPTGAGARRISSATADASIAHVSGSTSTKYGTRPAFAAACADAMKVHAGITHSVPGLAPCAPSASVRPQVAFATVVTVPDGSP